MLREAVAPAGGDVRCAPLGATGRTVAIRLQG
jgi:hypothetical protein